MVSLIIIFFVYDVKQLKAQPPLKTNMMWYCRKEAVALGDDWTNIAGLFRTLIAMFQMSSMIAWECETR